MTKAEAKAAMALHHRRGISLKAAWAQVRHGVRASPGGTRKTRSAKSSNGSSPKGGRIGKIYQTTTTALGVLSPATDEALYIAQGARPSTGQIVQDLMNKGVLSTPYAENLIVEAATVAVDKKMGQAAAISRGSVSAILPEAFLGLRATQERGNGARAVHANWNQRRNGYNPATGKFDPRFSDFLTYRALKHGGQVARKLRTRSTARGGIISRLLEPIGENVLRPLGLTW